LVAGVKHPGISSLRICSSSATFNQKRAMRVRVDDSIRGLDRLEQLSILPADGFPEFVITA
jgi:hypothetical protein